ncbi:MAG: circadian clock KaiB family protein [Burkholderiaceae bacterium]
MEKGPASKTSVVRAVNGDITLFKLYVADETVASLQAQSNLNAIGMHYLHGQYEIELVDILNEPLRALSEGIIVTPTLVRVSPLPIRHIVGDLCDTEAVLQTLGLTENGKNGHG